MRILLQSFFNLGAGALRVTTNKKNLTEPITTLKVVGRLGKNVLKDLNCVVRAVDRRIIIGEDKLALRFVRVESNQSLKGFLGFVQSLIDQIKTCQDKSGRTIRGCHLNSFSQLGFSLRRPICLDQELSVFRVGQG